VKLAALPLACLFAFGYGLRAEEPLPPVRRSLGKVGYGHQDFMPTPEKPLGWRADSIGYHPGATPPTEQWEGAVTQKVDKTDPKRPVTIWEVTDDSKSRLSAAGGREAAAGQGLDGPPVLVLGLRPTNFSMAARSAACWKIGWLIALRYNSRTTGLRSIRASPQFFHSSCNAQFQLM
jgi:hypothetical protein